MSNYFISKESEKVLSDFLLRKKKSGKILFTKNENNGVSSTPILDFFSTFTDVIDKCRSKTISQVEAISIINSISSAINKEKKVDDKPINKDNIYRYIKKK